MVTTARYGSWSSPFAAADVARAKVSLSELCSDGEALYWLESRPAEAGRVVLVRAGEDGLRDHSPPGVSIRSRVNEYGGGALCLVPGRAGGAFAYVDQSDQRVWFCDGAADVSVPRPLTPEPPEAETHNHGGLGVTPDGDWVLAVREVHRERAAAAGACAASSRWRPVPASPPSPSFSTGTTSSARPRWTRPVPTWRSSCGTTPTCPGTPPSSSSCPSIATPPLRACCAPRESRRCSPEGRVNRWVSRAGGATAECASCRTGKAGGSPTKAPGPPPSGLSDAAAEFHGPDWVLGQSTLAELPDGRLVARMTSSGRDSLVLLGRARSAHADAGDAPGDPTGDPVVLDQPCVSIAALCAHRDGVALIGATPDAPSTVWLWRTDAGAGPVRPPATTALGPGDVARGDPFTLTGRSGRPVYGTLYRPARTGTRGPGAGAPPLVVWCHGGPTSACGAGLDLTIQFFTTRGFAVACVDYAGSSGYGRAYRCALWGQWGVADSEDCLDAARHLAARGDADPERLAIRGGSAGGMTALNALAAGEGFAACVSWYGVTDLMGLVATTHDFEAHYTDRLIGPLPGSEDLYEARSPRSRARAMRGSVLLLQGTEDKVVPPAQAESMRGRVGRGRNPV